MLGRLLLLFVIFLSYLSIASILLQNKKCLFTIECIKVNFTFKLICTKKIKYSIRLILVQKVFFFFFLL